MFISCILLLLSWIPWRVCEVLCTDLVLGEARGMHWAVEFVDTISGSFWAILWRETLYPSLESSENTLYCKYTNSWALSKLVKKILPHLFKRNAWFEHDVPGLGKRERNSCHCSCFQLVLFHHENHLLCAKGKVCMVFQLQDFWAHQNFFQYNFIPWSLGDPWPGV